jgi:hypothetical protein
MTRLDPATLFCTDEDLLILAPGDYLKLVPADQVYASADDGVIAAGEWTLASASTPFASQGVRTGMICSLEGTPAQLAGLASKRADLLVVEAVVDNALMLRRKAEAAGKGQPPARSDASSLPFRVLSLWPQIEATCYDIRSDYAIDDGVVGRRFVDLVDPRELNQAAALLTLSRLYEALNRGGDNPGDAWAAKAKLWAARYDAIVGRSLVHFRRESPGYGGPSEVQNGQCRVVR